MTIPPSLRRSCFSILLLLDAASTASSFVAPNIGRCVLPSPYQHYRRTHLAASASSASNIAAGSTLIASSLCGILFERKISKSSGGHVVTLLAAALLSNISQVISRIKDVSIFSIPTDHFLYDWCWSVFLPASLVFALLSSSSSPSSTAGSSNSASTPMPSKSNALKNTILGMTLPFLAGSLGSIAGCITAFRFVDMPYTHHTTALLAGCLCASYIGGTVNFFATAKVLKDFVGGESVMGSAFGSMAAADLVVMALYFATLTAASKSTWLHQLFPSKCRDDNEEEESRDATSVDQSMATKTSSWTTFTATVLASSMALISVLVATRLEQTVTNSFLPPFNCPGTMCAFLALFGLGFERLISLGFSFDKLAPSRESSISSATYLHMINSLREISNISPTMSDICFYLLFGAVGASADLSSAVAGGPTALAFAAIALLVHSITVVVATLVGMRLGKYTSSFIKPKKGVLNKFHWPQSSWEEVLTASNAAIGGPSTAAAFAAGLIRKNDDKVRRERVDRNQYRSALVIGATFWGVFGYAIATGVGVIVSRFLMHCRQ